MVPCRSRRQELAGCRLAEDAGLLGVSKRAVDTTEHQFAGVGLVETGWTNLKRSLAVCRS